MFPFSLSSQIDKIESSIKHIRNGNVTVHIDLPIHDDVPEGFVKIEDVKPEQATLYRKVVDAKDGFATKSIVLSVPE